METYRWEKLHEFRLLDLTAARRWMSASSVTFSLGTWSGDTEFWVIGHLDLHYPCAGHIKAQMRACLPEQYFTSEHMRDMARELFQRVGITHDETYEFLLVVPSRQRMLVQPEDRQGSTGRTLY